MLQRLVDLDPLLRAERQALLHQVDRERVRLREERRERLALAEGHHADVLARPRRRDRVEVVERRRAEDVEDERELVVVVPPREERLPGEHFCEDAADRPDVYCARVLLEREHHFRSAVPATEGPMNTNLG